MESIEVDMRSKTKRYLVITLTVVLILGLTGLGWFILKPKEVTIPKFIFDKTAYPYFKIRNPNLFFNVYVKDLKVIVKVKPTSGPPEGISIFDVVVDAFQIPPNSEVPGMQSPAETAFLDRYDSENLANIEVKFTYTVGPWATSKQFVYNGSHFRPQNLTKAYLILQKIPPSFFDSFQRQPEIVD